MNNNQGGEMKYVSFTARIVVRAKDAKEASHDFARVMRDVDCLSWRIDDVVVHVDPAAPCMPVSP
jgi:hypothetical protein